MKYFLNGMQMEAGAGETYLDAVRAHFPDSGALGEGLRMVKAVSAQLLKRGRIIEWFAFGLNCLSRMLGNRAGRRQEKAHE